MLTTTTESAPPLHPRKRRHQAHHRARPQRSPHRLATNRPNHRRQATQRRQRRSHGPDMDRTVPEPRHAQVEEAERARRLCGWRQDQVPDESEQRAEGAVEADTMSVTWSRHGGDGAFSFEYILGFDELRAQEGSWSDRRNEVFWGHFLLLYIHYERMVGTVMGRVLECMESDEARMKRSDAEMKEMKR